MICRICRVNFYRGCFGIIYYYFFYIYILLNDFDILLKCWKFRYYR